MVVFKKNVLEHAGLLKKKISFVNLLFNKMDGFVNVYKEKLTALRIIV